MTSLPGGMVLYPSGPYMPSNIKAVLNRLSFLVPAALVDLVQDSLPQFENARVENNSPYGHVRFLTNA